LRAGAGASREQPEGLDRGKGKDLLDALLVVGDLVA